MRANVRKELENYFLILLGTVLMAIAIQWIFDRVGLITGGFRENRLCNHYAFGVALSDTGDRYVRG